MIHLLTLYKFKTPFFDFELEKKQWQHIYESTKSFLEFEGFDFQEQSTKTQEYTSIAFTSEDIQIVLVFANGGDLLHLPVFLIDLWIGEKLLQMYGIKSILENFFECFDGQKEKSYIIEFHNNFQSFQEVLCDFLNLENLQHKYKDEKKLIQTIEKFLQGRGVTQSAYIELEEILLYFTYMVFLLYQNIGQIKKSRGLQDELLLQIGDRTDFIHNIQLIQDRLEHLEDINIVTFNRYVMLLQQFNSLFVHSDA